MAKTFDNKDVSYNKGKAYNLSKGQLKKAGAAKAAAKRTVNISNTKRATSGANKGKTLGPAGKPLNGSVKLPSGVTAVYKDGKRVTAPRAKAKPLAQGAGQKAGDRTGRGGSAGRAGQGGAAGRPGAGAGAGRGAGRGGGGGNVSLTPKQRAARQAATQAGRASGQVPTAKRTYANGASTAKPASVGTAQWDKLSPSQKATFSSNVTKYAKALGLSPTKIAATIAAGKGSTLAKAAASRPSSGGTTSNPVNAVVGAVQNAAAGSGPKGKNPAFKAPDVVGAVKSAAAGSNKPGAAKPKPKPKGKSQVPDVGKYVSGVVDAVKSAAAGSNKPKK